MADFLEHVYKYRFGNDVTISVYASYREEADEKISLVFGDKFLRDHILRNTDVKLYVNEFPYD